MKLPVKTLDVIKYIAIGVGINESVIDDKKETGKEKSDEKVGGEDENQ